MPSNILLTINPAADADRQEVEELTQSLFTELEPIVDVSRVSSGAPPVTSKAIDATIVGQLALSLVQSGGVLVTAIAAVQAWLLRQNARSIIIEIDGTNVELGKSRIEIKGVSDEEQRRLAEAWIKLVVMPDCQDVDMK